MKFLKLEPGLNFETVPVTDGDTYKALSDGVGGLICSATGYFDGLPEGVDAWVNDEGLLYEGFEPVMIYEHRGRQMPLVGNVIFSRCDEEGETQSLTDEDIEAIKKSVINSPKILIYDRANNAEKVALYKLFT